MFECGTYIEQYGFGAELLIHNDGKWHAHLIFDF